METYARIENNTAREVIAIADDLNINELFHPDLKWLPCPPEAKEGWIVRCGQVVPDDDLDLLLDRVDQAAGAARARYITIAPGQGETYMQKTADANAYKAAGYTGAVPLMIEAEANAVGCTAKQAADLIIAQANAWLVKGSQIEQTRRAWKLTLATSEDRLADCAAAEAELGAL